MAPWALCGLSAPNQATMSAGDLPEVSNDRSAAIWRRAPRGKPARSRRAPSRSQKVRRSEFTSTIAQVTSWRAVRSDRLEMALFAPGTSPRLAAARPWANNAWSELLSGRATVCAARVYGCGLLGS